MPKPLEPGVLYISIQYKTASHLCPCGCGSRIVTPISPARWSMTFDGDTVSLRPSVGNWSLPCKSHYFITRDEVRWAGPLNDEGIEQTIRNDQNAHRAYCEAAASAQTDRKRAGIFDWLKERWAKFF